ILAGRSYPALLNTHTQVSGNFTVTGSKNSLQETENYGQRLINAYETAEYYFGDIGFGVINSDGECVVYIDDIFKECINTDCEYHVFTQVYNGAIGKIERHKDYFIIYGEENTEFSWELKAKRKGYENVRLDTPDIGTVEDIPVFTEEDLEVKTVEDTLLDVL
ncbi:phage tail spike protein, partial [Clostridium nigeriense]